MDPWRVLGVSPSDPPEAIRAAYLRLVRQHHPDRYREDPVRYQQEENHMKDINAAYHQIVSGRAARPGPAPPPSRPSSATRRPRSRPTVVRELQCAAHGRWAVMYCTECGIPLCTRCDPSLTGWCDLHRPR